MQSSVQAPTMCLRGTFIDFEADRSLMRRTRSEGSSQQKKSSVFFQDEEEYVRAVGRELDSWFSGDDASLHPPAEAPHDEPSIAPEAAQEGAPAPPLVVMDPDPTISSMSWADEQEVEEAGQADADGWRQAAQTAVEPPKAVDNPGSIGHPALCKRPCRFFAQGICTSGSSCEFCHLHGKHVYAPLDARNRRTLKFLGSEQRADLLKAVMRDGTREFACLTEADVDKIGSVDAIASKLSGPSMHDIIVAEHPDLRRADKKRLVGCLQKLPFANFTGILWKYGGGPSVLTECAELIEDLRQESRHEFIRTADTNDCTTVGSFDLIAMPI